MIRELDPLTGRAQIGSGATIIDRSAAWPSLHGRVGRERSGYRHCLRPGRSGLILPMWLNVIGLIVGAAGILTLVPALSALGAVFGLTQIVWFIGLGVVLLQRSSSS